MDKDLKRKEELRQRVEQAFKRKVEAEEREKSADKEQKRLDAEKAKNEIEEAKRVIEAEHKRIEEEKIKETIKQREELQERIEKADSKKRKALIISLLGIALIIAGTYVVIKVNATNRAYEEFMVQNWDWEELTFDEYLQREKQFNEILDLPFLSSEQENALQYTQENFEEMFQDWVNADLEYVLYSFRGSKDNRRVDELGESQNVIELTSIRESIDRLSLVPHRLDDFVPKKYLDELAKVAKANDLYYDLRTKSYQIYIKKRDTEEVDNENIVEEEDDDVIYQYIPSPPPPVEEEIFVEEESSTISSEEKYFIEEKREVDDNVIHETVEEMPVFPGGQKALLQYIANNVKYPAIAQQNGVEGRVVVRFIVEKDGSIGDVEVLRGVDPSLDAEAVRVVKSLPRFVPAKQNGYLVRVWYTLPVSFKLM